MNDDDYKPVVVDAELREVLKAEMKRRRERGEVPPTDDEWADQPIPEDAAIAAAHPLETGRHDVYAEALRMVEAKHSKYALVDLVNWLLVEAGSWKDAANAQADQLDAMRERAIAAEEQRDALREQLDTAAKWVRAGDTACDVVRHKYLDAEARAATLAECQAANVAELHRADEMIGTLRARLSDVDDALPVDFANLRVPDGDGDRPATLAERVAALAVAWRQALEGE